MMAPVSADHKSDGDFESWCITSSTGDTIEGCSASTVSQHRQVLFNEYKFYNSKDNNLILLPEVENNAGEDAKVEITAYHRDNEIDSVNITVEEERTESFQFELDLSTITHDETIDQIGYEVNVYNAQGEHKGSYEEGPESYRISNETISSNTIFTDSETFRVVPKEEQTIVAIENTILDISRYNAGGQETKTLEEDSLPPLQYNSQGEQVNSPNGEILFPEQLKKNNNRASVLTNQNGELEFGTAYYGIHEANRHRLNVFYGLQTESDTDYVQVRIVDKNGNPISPDMANAESRRLNNTVENSINFNTNEQYEEAIDNETVQENSKTIELTDAERKYVNDNYEAYVTYDATEGDNTFFLYRATISSSDIGKTTNEEGIYIKGSEFVERTQQNTWYANNTSGLNESNISERNWYVDGELRYTGEEFETSFDETGNYTLKVTSKSNQSEIYSDTKTVVVQNFSEKPATFNATYTPVRSEDEYGQVSLKPDEKFTVQVTIRNRGDNTVERELGLREQYNENFNSRDTFVDTSTVRVGPRSTKTVELSTSWPPHEYGNRTMGVYETSTAGNEPIPRENDGNNSTSVYVLQPATAGVELVEGPGSHLIYDNFNAEILVQNRGDLDTGEVDTSFGDPSVTLEFDEWVGSKEVDLSGGDVRAGQPGEQKEVRFARDGTNYTPSLPGLDYADRPYSPYSENEGTHELVATPDNPFAQPNNQLYTDITENKTDNTTDVRIYYAEVITMKVRAPNDTYVREDNETVWQASAYPYIANDSEWDEETQNINGDTGVSTGKYDTDKELANTFGPDTMPATGGYTTFHPVSQGYYNNDTPINQVVTNVTVYNNGSSDVGRTRVYITTNKSGFNLSNESQYDPYDKPSISGEIVGIAGLEMEPHTKHNVDVPVVIPNVEENEGVHNLEAHVRTLPDYTRQYPDGFESQWETNVTISVYGDIIITDFENQTEEINELCSGRGSGGNCNGTPTNDTTNFTYTNRGGAEGNFTISGWFEWVNDPTDHEHPEATQVECVANNSSTCDYMYNTTEFWNQSREQLIEPNNTSETWRFEHEFEEPGEYEVRANILRETTANNSSQFNENNIEGGYPNNDSVTKTLRVLDITDPISRFMWKDTDSCCRPNMVNENTIWEGGTLRYDGTEFSSGKPSEHPDSGQITLDSTSPEDQDYNQSGSGSPTDNVGIEEWNWDEDGSPISSSTTWSKRYDDPGTYNVELTVSDYDALTDDQNTNTKSHTINVQADGTAPDLVFEITDYGTSGINYADPADDTGKSPSVWANYGYIDTRAEAEDNGIGIEEAQILASTSDSYTSYQSDYTYSGGGSESCDDYFSSFGQDEFDCWSFPTPSNVTTQTGTFENFPKADGSGGGVNVINGPDDCSNGRGYPTGLGIYAQDFANNTDNAYKNTVIITDTSEPCVEFAEQNPDDNANCTSGNASNSSSRCWDSERGGNASSAQACVEVRDDGPNGAAIGIDYGASSSGWSGGAESATACLSASASTPEPEQPDECGTYNNTSGETDIKSQTFTIQDYHGNANSTRLYVEANSSDRSKYSQDCQYVDVGTGSVTARGRVNSIKASGSVNNLENTSSADVGFEYRQQGSYGGWNSADAGTAGDGESFSARFSCNNQGGGSQKFNVRATGETETHNSTGGTKTVTCGNPPTSTDTPTPTDTPDPSPPPCYPPFCGIS